MVGCKGKSRADNVALQIISINVCGLGCKTKRRAIFNYYKKRADILCMQETHSIKEIENMWQNEWSGEIFFSHGTSEARGVATLINPRCGLKVIKISRDKDG